MSISSQTTRVLDIAPYNISLSLSCSTTVVTVLNEPAPVFIETVWLQANGSDPSLIPIPPESYTNRRKFGSTVTSNLTLTTTQPGQHNYSCQVTLDLSPATDTVSDADTAIIDVIGQSSIAARRYFICLFLQVLLPPYLLAM